MPGDIATHEDILKHFLAKELSSVQPNQITLQSWCVTQEYPGMPVFEVDGFIGTAQTVHFEFRAKIPGREIEK